MAFWQFLVSQLLLFIIHLLSISLLRNLGGFSGYLAFNALTFITAGWILVVIWRRPRAYGEILAITLSFNLVTYLIEYAAGLAWPPLFPILGDFAYVAALSVVGGWIGSRRRP